MQETLIVAPFGTLMEKVPSAFVTVPTVELPTTITEAPMTGRPCASTTVPLIERVWAERFEKPRQPKNRTNKALVKVENNFCFILYGLKDGYYMVG